VLMAVFSDTHGWTEDMLRAVRIHRPDIAVHLGDFVRDALALREEFPALDVRCVRGNCDVGSDAPEKLLFTLEGVSVFMTHGHLYYVKYTLDSLRTAAQVTGARLVLFGHTHERECRDFGAATFLNPGSAGTGRKPSFALVELGGGSAQCRILDL